MAQLEAEHRGAAPKQHNAHQCYPEARVAKGRLPPIGHCDRRTAAIVEGHVRFEDGQSAVHGLDAQHHVRLLNLCRRPAREEGEVPIAGVCLLVHVHAEPILKLAQLADPGGSLQFRLAGLLAPVVLHSSPALGSGIEGGQRHWAVLLQRLLAIPLHVDPKLSHLGVVAAVAVGIAEAETPEVPRVLRKESHVSLQPHCGLKAPMGPSHRKQRAETEQESHCGLHTRHEP
mmetsp:Transcript_53702/g.110884  ORF Transcript_53702/g.110884 Transcript_53702/m.110884 type:complete len:230 (-) Transcript_53702:18-707(-)